MYIAFSLFCRPLRVLGSAPSIAFAISKTLTPSSGSNPSIFTASITCIVILFREILDGDWSAAAGANLVLTFSVFSSTDTLLGVCLRFSGVSFDDDAVDVDVGAADGFVGASEGFAVADGLAEAVDGVGKDFPVIPLLVLSGGSDVPACPAIIGVVELLRARMDAG